MPFPAYTCFIMKEKREISQSAEERTEKIYLILKLHQPPMYLPSAITPYLSDGYMGLCHFELMSAVNQKGNDSHEPSVP